jgi:hypothetical protein
MVQVQLDPTLSNSVARRLLTYAAASLFVPVCAACGGPSRCKNVVDNAYTWASGTSMVSTKLDGLAYLLFCVSHEASARIVLLHMTAVWQIVAAVLYPIRWHDDDHCHHVQSCSDHCTVADAGGCASNNMHMV